MQREPAWLRCSFGNGQASPGAADQVRSADGSNEIAAHQHGSMRVLGPHTIGVVNLTDRVTLSASGAMPAWERQRNGEVVRVKPSGPLVVQIGGAVELVVDAACAGLGIVPLYEDWLRPHPASGALAPMLDGKRRPCPRRPFSAGSTATPRRSTRPAPAPRP